MKRVAILLGMGLFLVGPAVWAQDELDMPQPVHLTPVHLTPVAAAPAPACCPAACAEHGHSASFCDWLMYHPPHTHCACPCAISPCYPPLHTWFLDMCQGGCGGRCHHAASETVAPCANMGCKMAPCANKGCNPAPCVNQGCPTRSWSLLDWLGLED